MDNIKSFNEFHKLDEAYTKDVDFRNLIKHLDDAIESAIKVNKKNQEEYWDGDESVLVGSKLEEIYAAFSTGNPRDKSQNDEYFK